MKNFLSTALAVMTLIIGFQSWAVGQVKTNKKPINAEFKFIEPGYTTEERKAIEEEVKAALAYEALESTEQKDYNNVPTPIADNATTAQENGDDILVEIYQNAPKIKVNIAALQSDGSPSKISYEKRQFMVVKQNNNIRYVFQISAAAPGKSTPESVGRIIAKQRWRHMSTLYPSSGENNMDHVSYFNGAIGFHSTVFGLYSKLGKADSHGCVRMARPEARVLFALIKENFSTTKVNSYKAERNPPAEERELISKLLQLDVDFINQMKKLKNKGDTLPGNMSYNDYINLKTSGTLNPQQIEISPDQDNFFVNPDLARN